MMKTMAKIGMVCLMLAASLTAQANVITSIGKETLEQTSKVLTKVVLREGAEEAGEQAVRAAVKKSPRLAKIAKEVGEDTLVHRLSSPNARKLIDAYGDDAIELIAKHGDDAAAIMQKHGKMGGELLELVPSEAKSISGLSKDVVREVMSLKQAGTVTGIAFIETVKWCGKHPVAASFMGAWIASPGFRALVGALCDMGMAAADFAQQHPYTAAIIALVLLGLVIVFKKEIKAGLLALLLLPLRLLRWAFKKCFSKQPEEKKDAA